MKKVLSLLVILGFAVAMVACGGQKKAEDTETTTEEVEVTSEAPADTTAHEHDHEHPHEEAADSTASE